MIYQQLRNQVNENFRSYFENFFAEFHIFLHFFANMNETKNAKTKRNISPKIYFSRKPLAEIYSCDWLGFLSATALIRYLATSACMQTKNQRFYINFAKKKAKKSEFKTMQTFGKILIKKLQLQPNQSKTFSVLSDISESSAKF